MFFTVQPLLLLQVFCFQLFPLLLCAFADFLTFRYAFNVCLQFLSCFSFAPSLHSSFGYWLYPVFELTDLHLSLRSISLSAMRHAYNGQQVFLCRSISDLEVYPLGFLLCAYIITPKNLNFKRKNCIKQRKCSCADYKNIS